VSSTPFAITGEVSCWTLRAKKRIAAASAGVRAGMSPIRASRMNSNTLESAA
jgi:hypothetical protein